jgi:ribosome-associated protein
MHYAPVAGSQRSITPSVTRLSGHSSVPRPGRHTRTAQPPRACAFPPSSETEVETDTDEPDMVDLSEEIVQKTKKVRARTGNFVDEMQSPSNVADSVDTSLLPPVHLDEIAEYARTAVRASDKRKAIDPIAIRIANLTYITTFMVCLTGKNSPQIRAIANIVEEELFKEHGLKPKRSALTPNSGWLLLDYGDLMVHIFSPEQRDSYDMESLWRKGERLDISDCLVTGPAGVIGAVDVDNEDDDWLA